MGSTGNEVVLNYLQNISEAIDVLTRPLSTLFSSDLDASSADYYLDHIARTLLYHVCDPSNLSQPVPEECFPQESQNENEITIAIKNRIDVLRNIFRVMPCIALDIAARVSSIVLTEEEISIQTAANAFVLFGFWVPIAPQLAQFVSDLFQVKSFTSPLKYIDAFYNNTDGTMDVDSGMKRIECKDIAIFSEAAYHLVKFYSERGDHTSMKRWWEWTSIFSLLGIQDDDTSMEVDESIENDTIDPVGWALRPYKYSNAVRWFCVRTISHLMNLTPASRRIYILSMGLEEEMVPWVPHPWTIIDEETIVQNNQLKGVIAIVRERKNIIISTPTPLQIRDHISLPSSLVHLGNGLLLPRKVTAVQDGKREIHHLPSNSGRQALVMTETMIRNLSLLGTALASEPYPPPILVCGPRGSGKSSLIRELAHYCSMDNNTNTEDDLLELHVDEETDSKTLLGSYAATDIPGEFTWRPGALTNAVRSGKWVLLEDVESCPAEIQAALVKLLEERVLPLGIGKSEKCHPSFRLFGTCTTNVDSKAGRDSNRRLRMTAAAAGSGGKRILHPGLWRKVHVDPLPYSEIQQVSRELFPYIPEMVSEAALNVLRIVDSSGRLDINDENGNTDHDRRIPILGRGRHSSVRDLMKVLRRISSSIHFEPGVSFCTESQNILCMAEAYDIFAGWCPCINMRNEFVTSSLAPIWGISATTALRYIKDRQPQIKFADTYIEVGRAVIKFPSRRSGLQEKSSHFAETYYALRLMESAAVCIAQNEPALLVGETGCGKTTLIQRLASISGHELIVQNLSLQTDSTDILGGYRPLEIRHIARSVYTSFVQLFVASFSKSQNAQFLDFVTASYEKSQWKKLSQCFQRASKMGIAKMKQMDEGDNKSIRQGVTYREWSEFKQSSDRFERQRIACETGLAFVFTEGALVDAIRTGKWILLDEINLASSETLERLCGLLDDSKSSLTLTEKGDSEALKRHPDFRIFAAMNPATDAGKKDLPSSLRSRFSEIYVDELIDPIELRHVAAKYLRGIIAASDVPLEHTENVIASVEVYLRCRHLSEQMLVDGSGQRPRYTLRTLCRALSAARNLITQQKFSIKRALLEGFELGFEGTLDSTSKETLRKLISSTLGKDLSRNELDHPGKRPGGRKSDENGYELCKPFWLKTGPLEKIDWSDLNHRSNRSRFVLTPSMEGNLRRLSRAVAAGPWPVLLEGPTSAGKTTMIEYLAARCGHRCVRINNHEHTDIQEYTGSYASDSNGKLCFQEGILVQALRKGHWVILDELNLAPSEVLEALNRLLDDNRELYLAETNEVVKPHPNFKLFATQNPSGAYGGRKPLSRAFRNRFVEMHMGDIPEQEMITILEKRCKCPPSYAKLLVKVMTSLQKRRSKSGVFRGKDGLITPRDLLRWAERKVTSKQELALQGYMLLAERLRDQDEKIIVKEILEEQMKVEINPEEMYYGQNCESRQTLSMITQLDKDVRSTGLTLQAIAPTKSLLRLLTLVEQCVEQKEPVLLVGDTGCGKTTVVQLLSVIYNRDLQIVNCHASTETSDLLGGLRPTRGKKMILRSLIDKARKLAQDIKEMEDYKEVVIPSILFDASSDYLQEKLVDDITLFIKRIRSVTETLPDKLDRLEKRRKLENGKSEEVSNLVMDFDDLEVNLRDLESYIRNYFSLFEWVDGPLVRSMKKGDLFLLDEMSLADDAVLERLNSVLEPSRTLVLAERGGDLSIEDSRENTEIKAHENFRIFATMNPGGDFGKRELSPALRSRFTEIWVPSVTDTFDIDLVLGQTLNVSFAKHQIQSLLPGILNTLKKSMLNYVNWFNVEICGKPMSQYSDFVLSLRDVLSWARFVVEIICNDQSFSIWSAYAHGASLMHLDGLGLGTGLSQDDARKTRDKCKSFLSQQVPSTETSIKGFHDEFDFLDENLLYGDNHFGIEPFVIPNGGLTISGSLGFKLNAPTTGMNLRRVLRAMQVKKPILLEGSPGVGKTSLISALAKASGHTLVRINLSEQTDISDLMGGDLPIPENNRDDVISNESSFRWCDGALLKAIKNGHWVLLDELNLASQTVLEGLNSCLDHRACVYIPELGKTFECPPTFRIFAAQNPLAQGGGRKGLPKSFLNRFTKVYIEALTQDDLFSIVSTKFPVLNKESVQSIVQFNTFVQEDIDTRRYGQLGSPWEFNLRDVFRWCELISNYYDRTGIIDVGAFADTIYIQRLRCHSDRKLLSDRYEYCFGYKCIRSIPRVTYDHESAYFGLACLKRNSKILDAFNSTFLGEEPNLFRSLLSPLEAVSLCVELSWPCLLVGSAASGKSTILKLLAESCNMRMEEIALTPSSDVSELIGSFEQIDAAEAQFRLLSSLTAITNAACLNLTHTTEGLCLLKDISTKYHVLIDHVESLRNSLGVPVVIDDDSSLQVVRSILKLSRDACKVSKSFSDSTQKHIRNVEQDLKSFHTQKSNIESNGIHFRWFDGALVEALENGYWIHLENVNLCSASVLDRLNPLMESGGELVLTECGIEDDKGSSRGSSRIVRPHPDFRIFLSMNPIFGEVSRAMRNRCIEVSILPSTNIQSGIVDNLDTLSYPSLDSLDRLWASGIRSASLAQYLIRSHVQEFSNNSLLDEMELARKLREWSALSVDSLNRGICGITSVKVPKLLAHEIHHDEYNDEYLSKCLPTNNCVIEKLSSRKMLESSEEFSRVLSAARLLRFTIRQTHIPLGLWVAENTYQSFNDSIDEQKITKICLHLIGNYMKKTIDKAYCSSILDGYSTDLSSELRYLAQFFTPKKNKAAPRSLFLENRLPHILEQHRAFKGLECVESLQEDILNEYSPLQISYCIYENKVDRSLLTCPVTGMLYPFFEILDSYIVWLDNYLCDYHNQLHIAKMIEAIRSLLCSRDRFWRFLNTSSIRTNSPFLAFDDDGFFVHWNWVKKNMNNVSFSEIEDDIEMPKSKRDLDLLIRSIDKAVNIKTGVAVSLSRYFWKNTGLPLIPANSKDSVSVQALYDLATQYTLINEQDFGYLRMLSGNSANISMQTLFDRKHGSLIFNEDLKKETLIALSMAHWATTDETAGLIRSNTKDYNVAQVVDMLQRKLSEGEQKLLHSISSCITDLNISREENVMDSFDLEKIREKNSFSSDRRDFSREFLDLFSKFQLSPIVEFIFVQEEERIVDSLMKLLQSAEDDEILEETRICLLPRIKAFISSVISSSLWSVSELRPYQSIVWSLESSSMDVKSLKHLLLCVHTTLLTTLHRHYWCNSFNDTNSLSDALSFPAFWNSERVSVKEEFEKHNISTHFAYSAGRPRISQNFVSDYIFRLQGFERIVRDHAINKVPYRTLENNSCRCTQAQKLIELLSERIIETKNDDTCSISTTLFLLEQTSNALRTSFTNSRGFSLFHDAIMFGDVDSLSISMTSCLHQNLNAMHGTVLSPLVISVKKMISDPNPMSISEVQIYLGLLRFHLLIPASPFDPGKKPAAKVLQWQSILEDIESELVALQMEERLETGTFEADGDYATKLLEDISHSKYKQNKQRKKQIERPKGSNSFYELFRDIHHFANTIGSVKTVTSLHQDILEHQEGAQHKEINWQSSAAAFSSQLHSKYKYFEDVITPILASMGAVQQGIRMLLNIKGKQLKRSSIVAVELQDELLRYPNVRFSSKISEENLINVSKAFDLIPFSEEEKPFVEKCKKDCQLSLMLSALSSLCINRGNGIWNDDNTLNSISSILKLISDAWLSSHSVHLQIDNDETEEERQERQLREQFPDYAKEFQKTITAIETIEQGGDFVADENDGLSELETSFYLSDDHVAFLCDIHHEIFIGDSSTTSDFLRLQSFIVTYTAAAQLNNALKSSPSILAEVERVNSHAFALAVNVKNDSKISFQSFLQPSCNGVNFHRDANPVEVLKADAPLEGLLIRVSQLMNAFPGNSILLSLGQIAENMRKMDVQKTSVGKMLVGLEVILRRAQEWEQHSSEKVSLGENLARLSRLVAQWRKLELQSWNNLLDVRDNMNIKRAKQHFMRLYNIIVNEDCCEKSQSTSKYEGIKLSSSSPLWVWKGFGNKAKHLASQMDLDPGHDQDFTEKLRLLDTFILTSGIGQFIHRLNLVESLANQVQSECQRYGPTCRKRYAQSVILKSFVEHYKQFEPTICNVIQRIRTPLETKLKNEVKLAKWDEQTYYSLTESTEKSHAKLMMHIREYETGLATTVTSVLEETFLNGIRSGSDVAATQSPVTEMPSNKSMFPDLGVEKLEQNSTTSENPIPDSLMNLRCKTLSWTQPSLKREKLLYGMPKYYKKMTNLFSNNPSNFIAKIGCEKVNDLCEAIFERLDILRKKGTKPMKHRALVDLFKNLKQNGYSSMKWSVPSEIRDISRLFLLRGPNSSKFSGSCIGYAKDAESYFRKCTVEVSRLRSEVDLFGSEYMSKREMDLMVGFSDHGLLMLSQQRSTLFKTVEDLSDILLSIHIIDQCQHELPSDQTSRYESLCAFDKDYSCLLETLRQTFVMTKTLATRTDHLGSISGDIIAKLQSIISLIAECYTPGQSLPLVTFSVLKQLEATQKNLEKSSLEIEGISRCIENTNIFPKQILKPCKEEFTRTLYGIAKCLSINKEKGKVTDSNAIAQISDIVESCLITAQILHSKRLMQQQSEGDEIEERVLSSIGNIHSQSIIAWDEINLSKLSNLLHVLIQHLRSNDVSDDVISFTFDASKLVLQVLDECQQNLLENLKFYRSLSKLEYIKLRLFRVLVAKGFCSDDVEEGGDAEGDTGDGRMNFEDDVEGTGMGEGEGKEDVTDQIENEEQLLGLKGDERKEKEQNSEQKQLNEEEAETGMEMDNDFDGEMFDVPDNKDDIEKDQNDDGEEELDREMGDGSDPNEQVVDEKMWDEDDEEDEQGREEEKFEKDSKMEGETIQDELRTKEDDEGDMKSDEKNDANKDDDEIEKPTLDNQFEDSISEDQNEQDGDDDEELVNNDFEDNYEDKNVGVDVRNEQDVDSDDNNENEEPMDLEDELNLEEDADDEADFGSNQLDQENEAIEDENKSSDELDQNGNEINDQEEEKDDEENENESPENENLQSTAQTLGEDGQMNEENEENEEENHEDDILNEDTNFTKNEKEEEAHGITATSGADKVKRQKQDEGNEDDGEGEQDDQYGKGDGEEDEKSAGAGKSDATSGQIQDGNEGSGSKPSSNSIDAPNPFRDPGDAEKFWHKKLNVISEDQDQDEELPSNGMPENDQNSPNPEGDFEFSSKDQDNSTQVLSGVNEEDATGMNQDQNEQSNETKPEESNDADMQDISKDQTDFTKKNSQSQKQSDGDIESKEKKQLNEDEEIDDDDEDSGGRDNSDESESDQSIEIDANPLANDIQVVTDLSQLQVRDKPEEKFPSEQMIEEDFYGEATHLSIEEAREKWSQISAETNSLSRRLCEKLRLVMEPLVASKLRGDYRTGKRINMKRVIGFIASGYRKDKIWLRRTKPGKRDYRILLAVDDSESMRNGAGDMALAALTTLANGMSQLEIGELGIASFGEEMKLLHPFHAPFTSSSGVDLINSFKFSDKRTRTALCVESALAALESQSNSSSSMQLVFIISDGRIERDNRERLRRVVREMTEKNILLVMLVVEGDDKGNMNQKDSIINMKEVSFENGKPKVKHFIDDYPFPYYMILQDMHSLPEVLGDALKQWFEMMAMK